MTELLSFSVVIVTQGLDTALTICNTLAGGRAASARTALGVVAGQAPWGGGSLPLAVRRSLLPQFAGSLGGLLALGSCSAC